jgi:hypothetical protein
MIARKANGSWLFVSQLWMMKGRSQASVSPQILECVRFILTFHSGVHNRCTYILRLSVNINSVRLFAEMVDRQKSLNKELQPMFGSLESHS